MNLDRDVYCVLGLPFDAVNLAQAAVLVNDAIEDQSRCFLSTPNLNFVIAAAMDNQFL